MLIYPLFFGNFVGDILFYWNMKRLFRYFGLLAIAVFLSDSVMAQNAKWREMHKVKRKETVFGIAREYGLTIDELVKANPDMSQPGYELKKGDYIFIPYPTATAAPKTDVSAQQSRSVNAAPPATMSKGNVDIRQRAVNVGVMLPLHDDNGDGRRMVEYYRGVLMACDSLKALGISVNVQAWNVAEDSNINKVLKESDAAACDLIIGPLYSKQTKALSDFAKAHRIKLLIPFSINCPEITGNPNIFQVYQAPEEFNEEAINRFLKRFAGYNTVIVDCNDTTSRKGIFTFGLRRRMEAMGRNYSITNVKSTEAQFAKAFSSTLPNVVILNTGRSPELNLVFAKLNNLTTNNPQVSVSMFGYTEWMMYTKYALDNFYRYNVYIPAAFYLNPLSAQTARIQTKYRWNFHTDMMASLPRFAVTGFDHAFYFIKGLHMYGDSFNGSTKVGYSPIQTKLFFQRVSASGGYKNTHMQFVHYTPGRRIESIEY